MGINFFRSKTLSNLQYVDLSEAYEAIKGFGNLPNLDHVTIKSSEYGVNSINISSPLTISDSIIRHNRLAGIKLKGRSKEIKIVNTAVDNTADGDGFSYIETVPDPVDFCSVDMDAVIFPVTFEAFGKARTNVECTKVRRCLDKAIPFLYPLLLPSQSVKKYPLQKLNK